MNKRNTLQFAFEYMVDIGAGLFAAFTAYFLSLSIGRMPAKNPEHWIAYAFMNIISFSIVYLGFNSSMNLQKRSKIMEIFSVLRNTLLTFMIIAVFLLITRNPITQTRYFFVFSIMFFFGYSCVGRYVLKRILILKFSDSRVASLVGVVSVGERAESFLQNLAADWGRKVIGIALIDAVKEDGVYKYKHPEKRVLANGKVSVEYATELETVREISGVPVVANKDDFMDWVRSASLDEIFINTPNELSDSFNECIEELESMGVTVHINIPVLENIINSSNFDNLKCDMYAGYPMASFSASELSITSALFKRIFDVAVSLVGSLVSLPIILAVAVPLLIESKGPLIFKQQRMGKNGRVFNIYKLRSMYIDAEERKKELMKNNEMDGFMFKMSEDPRITKVGKFIRKTSIDELPQFWNVLKGDMSLIGTRPPTVDEFEQYESHHKRRLSMKPGITGMWQVSGRSDIQDFEEIVRLDCEYIDNWSVWLDFKILFKTVGVVLKGSGAK